MAAATNGRKSNGLAAAPFTSDVSGFGSAAGSVVATGWAMGGSMAGPLCRIGWSRSSRGSTSAGRTASDALPAAGSGAGARETTLTPCPSPGGRGGSNHIPLRLEDNAVSGQTSTNPRQASQTACCAAGERRSSAPLTRAATRTAAVICTSKFTTRQVAQSPG